MAAEVAHHAEAVAFHEHLDGVAQVAQGGAGADGGDAAQHGFVGDVHQPGGTGGGGACHVHAAAVTVPAKTACMCHIISMNANQ